MKNDGNPSNRGKSTKRAHLENALHRDILGGWDNFDCNAHDQYSYMEANMAEIADAKCANKKNTKGRSKK